MEAVTAIPEKRMQSQPYWASRLLLFISRRVTVIAVAIAKKLKWNAAGPESRIAAIGATALVCWVSALAFQWIQHLFAGRNPTLWHPAGVGVALLLLW